MDRSAIAGGAMRIILRRPFFLCASSFSSSVATRFVMMAASGDRALPLRAVESAVRRLTRGGPRYREIFGVCQPRPLH